MQVTTDMKAAADAPPTAFAMLAIGIIMTIDGTMLFVWAFCRDVR
jgi:hypothetical protein